MYKYSQDCASIDNKGSVAEECKGDLQLRFLKGLYTKFHVTHHLMKNF